MQRATIAALASGRPPCAIAILRVSGPQAFAVARILCGDVPGARRAVLREVRRANGGLVDRALVLVFPAPASATGEDVIELHLHGGQAVIAAALDAVLEHPGVRLAEPGEFTRRAFDNGRLDLTQVEGLADLLVATTEAQRAQALGASEGALARRAGSWRADLLTELIEIEARLDFGDEGDVAAAALSGSGLQDIWAEMRAALARADAAERVREGLTVVLLGPPNAGKSSLLNAIVGRSAAIVAPTPGTTRDPIEVELDLGGVLVRLIDTAGLRDTKDAVESEGVVRARSHADRADLVLNLGTGEARGWRVRTRIDLSGERGGERDGCSYVSSVTGEGITALLLRLNDWARSYVSGEPALVTHVRQVAALTLAADRIAEAVGERDDPLRAESVRLALRAIGGLTGTVDVEDVLDGVFARFCVGK